MNNPFIIGYAIALACVIPVLIVQVVLSMIEAKKRGPWKLMIIALLITAKPAVCQDYGDLDALDAATSAKRLQDSIAKANTVILPDSTPPVNFGGSINRSGEVFVAESHPLYPAIAACKKTIDSLSSSISFNTHGKKLTSLDFFNQKKYCDYLLKYNLIDTATVKTWAGALLRMQQLDKKRCTLIMEAQTGANRAVVFRHIRSLEKTIAGWRSYIVYLQKL